MSRWFRVFVLLGTVLSLIWLWPSKNLQVVFCNVGQGDAILFSYRHYQVLVDGGANNSVLECLNNNIPFWDRQLEMVILTHPDKDHYQGLLAVAERYRLLYFVWGGISRQSHDFQKLLAQISNRGAQLVRVEQNDEMAVDKIKIKFYWPNPDWLLQQLSDNQQKTNNLDISKGDGIYQREPVLGVIDENTTLSLNDFSLVFNVSFDNFDVLMMGDADSRIQPEMMNFTNFPDVEIFKVAHHGSKYAFTDQFLASFKSFLAIISVGPNPWGHPSQDLLNQLDRFGLTVLRTDQEGDIKLISDGRIWWRE
ncbi:MAG: hypothetical protein PHX72_00575 [Candidatus Shapirobacteria bacterium]|nr:hypothetical protein [Candidatus Shapirobacteria bacterium]